jgi:hypothetical protein
VTLADWRGQTLGLTLQAAARQAGIAQAHAHSIEQRPDRASLGALKAYVSALGGVLRVTVERGGVTLEVSL